MRQHYALFKRGSSPDRQPLLVAELLQLSSAVVELADQQHARLRQRGDEPAVEAAVSVGVERGADVDMPRSLPAAHI